MAVRFITADERLARPSKINIACFGPSGVGKTTLARTLDPASTLFVDLEAGTLALGDWRGPVLSVREEAARNGVHPWVYCRAVACIMGGPDPSKPPENPYSQASYEQYVAALGGPEQFAPFSTVFWDSVTVAGRYSFAWSQTQPEAFSEKTGNPDTRGAYGLHGRELIQWFTQIQHTPDKSTVLVGILNREVDDLKRVTFKPQIDGSKAATELPGIFDCVMSLDNVPFEGGVTHRAFVTKQDNPFGYPAKDRSGCLEPVEPPDLAALMAKIRAGKRLDGQLATAIPAAA